MKDLGGLFLLRDSKDGQHAMCRILRPLAFVGLGLVFIAGFAFMWFVIANARASAPLEARIDKLRNAGQPVSLADLKREPIPPEENAATFLAQVSERIQSVGHRLAVAEAAESDADSRAFDEGRPSPRMLDAIRAEFDAHPDVMAILEKAANCSRYEPGLNVDVDTSKFDEEVFRLATFAQSVAGVVNYRNKLLLGEGQPSDAFDDSLVMFRLVRHFEQAPANLTWLVSLAIRGRTIHATDQAMRRAPLTDDQHGSLDTELARHDVVASYRQALISERAFVIQNSREWSNDRILMIYRMFPQGKRDQCDCLDLLAAMIGDLKRPYSNSNTHDDVAQFATRTGTLTADLVSIVRIQAEALDKVEAQLRCLRVLNALMRDKCKSVNIAPALADLGLPAEATTDPYNGQPLRVKMLRDGWLVYSVGKNLIDDGGMVHGDDPLDIGLGPPQSFKEDPRAACEGDSSPSEQVDQ